MLKQMEKEAEEDEEIYEKMACWCETNDKEKTKAIADAEARISDLTTAIEDLTAKSASLNTEIEILDKEIAKNQKALDMATALRTKELAEFNAEEKDMLQSISSLKAAIVVLSKHHPGALLQQHQLQVQTMLQHELQKHGDLLNGVLTHRQRKIAASFVQAPIENAASFLQAPIESFVDAEVADPTHTNFVQALASAKAGSGAPASGEIFGILKQMKESFESNLSQSQKDELANQKAYEDLKAAKEEEIAEGQSQLDRKTEELATTDEKLAQSKQDIEDTRASLSADEKFLMNLKETCSGIDAEWEMRQKDRQLEIEGCSKALAILSSDDAHDLFSKTFNFLEKSDSKHQQMRLAASKRLMATAVKTNSPLLTALTTRIRLDAFTKVKKAIDDMVAQLLKDKEDEIKHKDYCVDGFNENEKETQKNEHDKKNIIQKIEDLTMEIDELTKAIETLKAEIAEMQVQMKRAGEDREKENKEFQQTVADQRATQKLLAQALGVLKGVYDKKAKAAFAQEAKDGQAPPPGFKKYKKNAAAGGVMGMIQQIINDAKQMEAEALRSEDEAQKAYEDFVKDTNASMEEKNKDIINKSELKAKAEADKTEKEEEKENVMLTLEQLSNEAADLHKACDFTLKNFDIRQTGRDEEIEALKQAKAILSGAKFSLFLQQP